MQVLPRIRTPENGRDADEDAVIARVIDRIQKEQLIDVSHIRNIQSFVKGKTRYKIEELMHGGGGSSTTSGLQYLPLVSGTIDGSNTTFTFASPPTIVVVNGSSYINGAGVTITGTTAVIASPAGVGGSVYALG